MISNPHVQLAEPLQLRWTQAQRKLLSALAAVWGLHADEVERYVSLHKPALGVSGGEVTVGRAMLPAVDADAAVKRSLMQAGQQQVQRYFYAVLRALSRCRDEVPAHSHTCVTGRTRGVKFDIPLRMSGHGQGWQVRAYGPRDAADGACGSGGAPARAVSAGRRNGHGEDCPRAAAGGAGELRLLDAMQ